MEFQLQQSIEILERTPKTLRSLLGGLSDPWLHGDEGPETFSPFDLMAKQYGSEVGPWKEFISILKR